MRIVDFLILTLRTHGGLLSDLSSLVGAPALNRILAAYDPAQLALQQSKLFEHFPLKPRSASAGFPFEELEAAVGALKLSEQLEHYVWAYPYYRTFIEGNVDIQERLPLANTKVLTDLAEEAGAQALSWINGLPLLAEERSKAEELSRNRWVRFRAELFKGTGKNPLRTVDT